MRIEQLEYIEAVTRFGSLRRAAEHLHLSQPTLSETLRNLERELAVDILDRKRSGAKISEVGQELLPHIRAVLDAVQTLRRVAGNQHHASRMVRIGTVNAATVSLVVPAIREFHTQHPTTQVEIIAAQQADIHRSLLDGGFDLGLVNYLHGDDMPPEFETTVALRGPAVACVRADSPLAARQAITADDLLSEPLIAMRSGYVMHRFAHRFLSGRRPAFSYSTDGAEMGKLMVAEGLGVTVLPEFSVRDDPLERAGVITWRPLEPAGATVLLVVQRRRGAAVPRAAQDLHRLFVSRGHTLRAA